MSVAETPVRAGGDALLEKAGVRVEHREADIAGVRTHWITAGDKSLPQAVLLHGSGGAAVLWYPVLKNLSLRRHVVAVDLPGFGESAIPLWCSPDAVEGIFEWLAAFLEPFEWPLLVGHSLGGYLALLHFARRRPKVAGLVLVDAGGIGPRPPGFVMATGTPVLGPLLGLAADRLRSRKRLERGIRRLLVDPSTVPWGQEALELAAAAAIRPGAARFQFEVYRSVAIREAEPGYKVWGRLHEISCPVLLVWGERDYFPLRFARQAAAEMPSAKLEVLAQTGHLSYFEDPQGFNRVLAGWLQATYEK